MGSVFAVKRRRGMSGLAESLVPVLVGGGIAAGTIVAVRMTMQPSGDPTKDSMIKHAPAIGMIAGGIAAFVLSRTQGNSEATGAIVAALLVGGTAYLCDSQARVAIETNGALPSGEPVAGIGAIVPEYGTNGLGAIVMQPSAGGSRPGSIGSYGETVSLSGIDTSVFGTPGF